jgi:hypothetical protein
VTGSRRILPIAFLTALALALTAAAFGASAAAACTGETEAIRSAQGSTYLPECRAWEQVSPTGKNDTVGGVYYLNQWPETVDGFNFSAPLSSSEDGNAILYSGNPFFESEFGGANQYLSTRGPAGWSTQNLTTAEAFETLGAKPGLEGVSLENSAGVLDTSTELAAGAPPGGYTIPWLRLADGTFQPLITTIPPHRSPATFGFFQRKPNAGIQKGPFFAGASSDFSHVVFEANDALTAASAAAPAAIDGGSHSNNVYEWVGGQLRLVNVLPGNAVTAPNAAVGVDYGDSQDNAPDLNNAVSTDGSHIFWTDLATGNLYVRLNGTATVQVDAPAPGAAGPGGGGKFQTATPNGSQVIFTDDAAAGLTTDTEPGSGTNLYLYEVPADGNPAHGHLTDLTASADARVEGILGTSEDASSVYFAAAGNLTGTEENEHHEQAQSGQPNLYLAHSGAPTFIATLSADDNNVDRGREGYGVPLAYSKFGDWQRDYVSRTARVSPNGRYVAFVSDRSLTGYDNLTAATGCEWNLEGTVQAGHCDEIFRYDSLGGQLVCASCNPDGSRPTDDTLPPLPFQTGAVHQTRWLDDSGQVFFESTQALVPEDTNAVMDVYEYGNGQVHLLSGGTGEEEPSKLAEASASGSDVFFTTRNPLVAADGNNVLDLYDARAGGGILAQNQETEPCAGEDCRPSVTEPPGEQGAGSAGFVGPPDETPHHKKPRPRKPHKHRRNHKRHHRGGHR